MRIFNWILGTGSTGIIGLVAILNVMGADVVLTNAGSQPIHVRGSLPDAAESALSAAGIHVPEDLLPGVPTVVRVPRLSGRVAALPGGVDLSLLGQTLHIATTCDRLDMNGASLLGRPTVFDLSASSHNEVQFACH